MMKGAVDFLLSEGREAALLRRRFVFRIVPMLNPDGVIYGNYRCGLLGVDLNRRWQSPSKFLHPTVYYTKRFLQYFSETHEIALFCDMHGHSMKKNMFVYANSLKSTQEQGRNTNVLIKLVPKLLAKANKLFSFQDSHFRIEPCKLSTARVVVFKELGVVNSYTLEASFYGPRTQAQLANQEPEAETEDQDAQMNTSHMQSLGRDLCRVMVAFTSQKAFRAKLNEVAKAMREEMLQPVPPSVALRRSEASSKFEKRPISPNTSPAEISRRSQAPTLPPLTPTTPSQPTRLDEDDDTSMDVQAAIQTISEAKELPEDLGKEDSCSDEGGSDSLGSDNDDSKQEYFYRKKHPLSKTKRKSKKDTNPLAKREAKPHSCLRHHAGTSHAFCRPKTPFVFGNYPERQSAARISKLLKSLHTHSPKEGTQSGVPVIPSQVLLAGFRCMEEPPKVRVVTGAGGLKNSALRVSFCPSTSVLHSSKAPDLSFRIRTSRIVEAICRESRLKTSSKLALRKLPATPVLPSDSLQ